MKHLFYSTLLIAALSMAAWAQDDSAQTATSDDSEKISALSGKLNGLEESYLESKSTLEKLSKIKVSGYIQTQLRVALQHDSAMADTSAAKAGEYAGKYFYPVGDFAGGKFADGVSSTFQIRRARIKVAYESKLTQGVVQFDAIPFSTLNLVSGVDSVRVDTTGKAGSKQVYPQTKAALGGGGLSLKDAYLRFTEPWLKSIAFKAGIFDRPFGFEIMYSSSTRESPERSRVFQTLFPGERDMGAMLEWAPGDNLPLGARIFNAKVGLFTGNGINLETDGNRDLIGRLGFSIPLTSINMAIDGGFSGYAGKVVTLNDTVKQFNATSMAFEDVVGTKKFDNVDRQYMGFDLQLYYDLPVIGGFSLRGEYLQGQQPGAVDGTGSPKSDIPYSKKWYLRNFNGFYGMLVQNINPINSQIVVKYDSYDPNTDITGDDLTSSLKTAELKWNTLGLGAIYHWDENVKFMLYYERVMNEAAPSALAEEVRWGWREFTEDLQDDVLTFRIQYKF